MPSRVQGLRTILRRNRRPREADEATTHALVCASVSLSSKDTGTNVRWMKHGRATKASVSLCFVSVSLPCSAVEFGFAKLGYSSEQQDSGNTNVMAGKVLSSNFITPIRLIRSLQLLRRFDLHDQWLAPLGK
ncbi:hypothetical protein CRG98_025084 [Punica granatum]|uniref:Uncharacterized protein n=1 Tax=Punica granatum TaxID=22663 RepID=A0A2I0JF76_PUNGR|nr:hypothetical protein CRG98_025084 [Punica granatum]